jgi:hypothetical protein
MKPIEGTIHFSLKKEDGQWDLAYTQSSENDLAVLAISQQIMEYSEASFDEILKDQSLSATQKKFFKGRLEKVRAAKFGINLQLEYLVSVFDDFKKFTEANNNKSAPEAVTPEEQAKIVEMIKAKK